jgi:arginyl-tRNA synthetase
MLCAVLLFITKESAQFISKYFFKKLDAIDENSKKLTELTISMNSLKETIQQMNVRIDHFSEITGIVYKLKNDVDAAHQIIRTLRTNGNA